MFNPYDRLSNLLVGKGVVSSSQLKSCEMRVVMELLETPDLNDQSRDFIRKAMGFTKPAFQILCPNDDKILELVRLTGELPRR